MEIVLYQLTNQTLESFLPRLLEKIYYQGDKCIVFLDSIDRCKTFDTLLWTYSTKTFLPHGICKNTFAKDQPILLTDCTENINDATVGILTYKIDIQKKYKKIIEICLDDRKPMYSPSKHYLQKADGKFYDLTASSSSS